MTEIVEFTGEDNDRLLRMMEELLSKANISGIEVGEWDDNDDDEPDDTDYIEMEDENEERT